VNIQSPGRSRDERLLFGELQEVEIELPLPLRLVPDQYLTRAQLALLRRAEIIFAKARALVSRWRQPWHESASVPRLQRHAQRCIFGQLSPGAVQLPQLPVIK